MLKFFSGLSSTVMWTIVGGLFAALVVTGGLLWWKDSKVTELTGTVATQTQQLEQWGSAYDGVVEQLNKERGEVKRINALLKDNVRIEKVIEYVEVEVTREIKVYRDNPNIPKCDLSPQWVYIHDLATQADGLPETGDSNSGGTGLRTGAAEKNGKLPKSVRDDDALDTIKVNYTMYNKLVNDYRTLKQVCSGEKPAG